ncbi:MAG TPA: hypothetical protein VEJ87_16555 [Acidimicrobiales bacterium]|nr:hypothetical protein [Acidimicrobiales bacterium]
MWHHVDDEGLWLIETWEGAFFQAGEFSNADSGACAFDPVIASVIGPLLPASATTSYPVISITLALGSLAVPADWWPTIRWGFKRHRTSALVATFAFTETVFGTDNWVTCCDCTQMEAI